MCLILCGPRQCKGINQIEKKIIFFVNYPRNGRLMARRLFGLNDLPSALISSASRKYSNEVKYAWEGIIDKKPSNLSHTATRGRCFKFSTDLN